MSTLMNNPLAREVARIALKAKYPNLTMVDWEGAKIDGLNAASKNAKAELKATFPGVKFSVKTSRFSGGDSMYVRWTDGPTSRQVEAIVNKYSAGRFDGSADIFEYNTTPWNEVFGDAKYVSASRDYSDALIEDAIRIVVNKFGGCEPITVDEYRRGNSYRWVNSGGCQLDRELSITLSKICRCMPVSNGVHS